MNEKPIISQLEEVCYNFLSKEDIFLNPIKWLKEIKVVISDVLISKDLRGLLIEKHKIEKERLKIIEKVEKIKKQKKELKPESIDFMFQTFLQRLEGLKWRTMYEAHSMIERCIISKWHGEQIAKEVKEIIMLNKKKN